ncbi:pyridoxal phosphate-dependent aminotransferase [Pyrinomonas methylaliphatogenes]|uniref:Aminotransferase n=1 Tax=Pyrinomonas methylaliphatogenes TaxID=454194 RepID=A0A0B6WYE3_9BACT|nr:aminotransferase class I/II-fold pyridoxal phosphate-dependent enzyme [Pyrinomonas methylaliphatogenes]MBX5479032.1 aminotransferase class I/II-fold pyridoxal phosphate-dependent enzyme [Pyrinomonas methylaliphatogenes]CDM66096.1 aspartate/tyrosine/aromatic aminotransferase [Pyrinomonas methylaliphatogenes]
MPMKDSWPAFQPPRRLRGIQKSAIRQLFDRAPTGSINLGLGEPDLPTPEIVRRTAARIVLEEQNGYTTHAGLPALRELIARDYADLSPDRVIVTAGSQEALYLALMTLVEEGDKVLLPNPGFVAYPAIVRMAGGEASFYRLPASRDFAFDPDEFRRRLDRRTKVVVLTSPSNPTGRVLTREDLIAIARALDEIGAWIISDEIYRELYYLPERPPSISEFYERTIVIGGLSKALSMTGWRLGWLCGPADVVSSALVLHGYVTTCASTIAQKAALVAWTDEASRARAQIRATFRARRDHLLEMIVDRLERRAIVPEGAFYTMLDVRADGPSWTIAEHLLAHGVITVPGSAFGDEAEGFLRLSFCLNEEALAEGVSRMKSAFQSLRRNPA